MIINKDPNRNPIRVRSIKSVSQQTDYKPYGSTELSFGNNILTPPFYGVDLFDLKEQSSILSDCIETTSKNITSYGYIIQKENDYSTLNSTKDTSKRVSPTSESVSKLLKYIKAVKLGENNTDFIKFIKQLEGDFPHYDDLYDTADEFQSLRSIVDNIHPQSKKTINDIFKIASDHAGLYGYCGIEVIFNEDKTRFELENIPVQYIYLTKQDTEFTEYTIIDARGVEIVKRCRFRNYVVIQGNSKTYFKDILDPRPLKIDGTYFEDGEEIDESLLANPMLFIEVGASSSGVYPIPLWLGALDDILGNMYATRLNKDWFEKGMLVPMALLVSGGYISDEQYNELKDMFNSSKGIDNRTQVLIIESEGAAEASDTFGLKGKSNVNMSFEKLPAMDMNDAQYLDYIDETKNNVRGAFNVPSILLGWEESYTRDTAKMAIEMFNQQVAQAYRVKYESEMNKLFQIVSPKTKYRFKLCTANVSDYSEYADMLKPFIDMNLIPTNIIINLINEIFNIKIPEVEDGHLPPELWFEKYKEKVNV